MDDEASLQELIAKLTVLNETDVQDITSLFETLRADKGRASNRLERHAQRKVALSASAADLDKLIANAELSIDAHDARTRTLRQDLAQLREKTAHTSEEIASLNDALESVTQCMFEEANSNVRSANIDAASAKLRLDAARERLQLANAKVAGIMAENPPVLRKQVSDPSMDAGDTLKKKKKPSTGSRRASNASRMLPVMLKRASSGQYLLPESPAVPEKKK